MTSIEHLRPVAAPGRLSQATAVEQSRAVAEVLAAVQVAQSCPRDEHRANDEMRRACASSALADRAFYRVPRGGSTVTGPSVHLARELARSWGNMDFGIGELRRDDVAQESEMRAWAWDQETNSRSSSTFIVKHQRMAGGRAQPLSDLNEIQLNNANVGARRLREAIFAVLPVWYVEEAQALCNQTLNDGKGEPIETRRAKAVERFAELGVTLDQIEGKLLRPLAQWDGRDLGHLTTVWSSLNRGEIDVTDEFPPRRLTRQDLKPDEDDDEPFGTPGNPDLQALEDDLVEIMDAHADADPVADPDAPPDAPPEPWHRVTEDHLLTALRGSGRIPARAPNSAARRQLLAACFDLTGRRCGTIDDVVLDHRLASELLDKLTADDTDHHVPVPVVPAVPAPGQSAAARDKLTPPVPGPEAA